MCYVQHSKNLRMIGWVGDSLDDLTLALFADADLWMCATLEVYVGCAYAHARASD